MEEWFTGYKIPIGAWMSGAMDFLNAHAAWLFNVTSDVLGFMIDGLVDLMQATPPLLLIALFAGLALWLHRGACGPGWGCCGS